MLRLLCCMYTYFYDQTALENINFPQTILLTKNQRTKDQEAMFS